MTYELRLPPDTQNEIRDFIVSRYAGPHPQRAALAVIEGELSKLAVNPRLGRVTYGGPFETRPIYRFLIDVDGVNRYVQVVYKLLKSDRVWSFRGLVLSPCRAGRRTSLDRLSTRPSSSSPQDDQRGRASRSAPLHIRRFGEGTVCSGEYLRVWCAGHAVVAYSALTSHAPEGGLLVVSGGPNGIPVAPDAVCRTSFC